MPGCNEEMMELFKELSEENQRNMLMCTRLAYIAENSVKKSLEEERKKPKTTREGETENVSEA